MSRGSWVALLLLLGASLAAVPGTVLGSTDCGLVVEQDDARQQRDAGASPAEAVRLPYEDEFPASMSYPQGPMVDTEDWFHVDWQTEREHRVMVNLSTRALGLTYMTDHRAPNALGLEAYEPGATEPTYEGEIEDGIVRLDFETTQSAWDFRVFLPTDASLEECPAEEDLATSSELQSYNLYWGCDPHCIHVAT